MNKFEYWILCCSDSQSFYNDQQELNDAGKNGWELVNALQTDNNVTYIFKRKKSS